MRRFDCSRFCLSLVWAAALAIGLAREAHAQGDFDCPQMCDSSTNCGQICEDQGEVITCNEYGVCDPDWDGDGVSWTADNCNASYNPGQSDCDSDGAGDACDPEDGIYQEVGSSSRCWIRRRLHLWGTDATEFIEIRMVDISNCGSPDKWRQFEGFKMSCAGEFDSNVCCSANFGQGQCTYYGINRCQ
jgi:hypothetical protein